ncbi:hypothetical protein FGG08_006078 [Glutinoglossum americanum]|uniref:Ornithine decarboxylase antizyme n=1 Tax=Glutinoglossum americanum TaxID=1670608 RepID=A0A9P8HTC9_9PEZI|nr:hypothetical protein FGG08_006078 [Glutinoglossum americanum]
MVADTRPNILASCYVVDTGLKGGLPRGGAAHTITEECERLFCESMKIVFLGERGSTDSGALVTGAHLSSNNHANIITGSPRGEANAGLLKGSRDVHEWLEVWDYVGGARFRGFVGGGDDAKSLFIFFDEGVIGRDLKHGLISLLELAGSTYFQCSQLVVCIDRTTDAVEMKSLMRDLGWVGFELITLGSWAGGADIVSKRWLFLGMDV